MESQSGWISGLVQAERGQVSQALVSDLILDQDLNSIKLKLDTMVNMPNLLKLSPVRSFIQTIEK